MRLLIVAILLPVVSWLLIENNTGLIKHLAAMTLFPLTYVTYFAGVVLWATGKGYSAAASVMFALAFPFGLIPLIFFPNREA